MKIRKSTVLLFAVLAGNVALEACGSRSTSDMATETGNPPFIQREHVTVDLSDGVARVTGEPGSVPAGATVRVTNTSSGTEDSALADDDGAFEAQVAASRGDEIEVSVEGQGSTKSATFQLDPPAAPEEQTDASTQASSDPTEQDTAATDESGQDATDDATGSDPNGDDDPLQTCEQQAMSLGVAHGAIANGVDTACEQDSDCVQVNVDYSCYTWACSLGAVISRQGQAQVDVLAEGIDLQCEAMLEAGCPQNIHPCPSPFPTQPVCVAGQCQAGGENGGASPDDPAAACTDAQTQANDLGDEILAAASVTCEQDDDCALSPIDFACGQEVLLPAVSTDSLTELQARQAEYVEACGAVEQSCSIPTILLLEPPPPTGAFCSVGMCQASGGACEDQERSAAQAVMALLADAQDPCTTDEDCVLVPSPNLPCADVTCSAQVAVAATSQSAFEARVEELEARLCEPFANDGCQATLLACDAAIHLEVPSCVANKCAAVSP